MVSIGLDARRRFAFAALATFIFSLTTGTTARAEEPTEPPTKSPPASPAEPPLESPSMTPPKTSIYQVDDPNRPTIPYREGTAVPDGYRVGSVPRTPLIVIGSTMLGTLWTVSTIAAIALDQEESAEGDPNFDDRYWPMFIPVVGPFITIKTADSSGTGAAILALDGAAQAAGLAMMIAGIAAPKIELIPQKPIYLTPSVGQGQVGLGISGSF